MKRKLLRAALVVVSLGALSLTVCAQQQRQRGSLDNMSLLAHGSVGAPDSAGWQTFAPEGAGFSILVPGTPEEEMKKGHESGILAPQFRCYKLTVADGVKYEFGRTGQFPAQLVGAEFQAQFFGHNAEMLTTLLQRENPQAHFKLLEERHVSVAGYDGHEYEFAGTGLRTLVRVCLIDRAIFMLSISGPEAALTNDKASKFFDSFTPMQ
jgi:hypothetical protein